MKFQKVPNEFRMISNEGNYELFLLSTGAGADRHFRLLSPLNQLDFDATLVIEPVPEWQVYRIFLCTRTNSTETARKSSELTNPSMFKIIEQALLDFGYFYGNEASKFGVSFVTDQVHRSH
jgi:hypothetical protein